MKIEIVIIPPIMLYLIDKEIKINNIPKYMGFLEYLKTFEITSADAFSGRRGLMVVFCFLKDDSAKTRKAAPRKKNEMLMILL